MPVAYREQVVLLNCLAVELRVSRDKQVLDERWLSRLLRLLLSSQNDAGGVAQNRNFRFQVVHDFHLLSFPVARHFASEMIRPTGTQLKSQASAKSVFRVREALGQELSW